MRIPHALTLTVALGLLLSNVAPALAAPPANDNINQPTVVTDPLPFTAAVSTVDATTATDDPDCVGNGPTVWYSYTPSASGWAGFDTFGSSYDTTLSAYTGTPGSLTQLDCNDDSGSLQSRVVLQLTAGTTYYFMAGAFASGPGGNLIFNASPSAPPADVTVAILDSTVQPSTGAASVRVGATASAPVRVQFISANLIQRSGRGHIIASAGLPLMNRTTNQVDVTVPLKDLTSLRDHGTGFVGGPAKIVVEFYYNDPTLGPSVKTIEQDVKLKGGRAR